MWHKMATRKGEVSVGYPVARVSDVTAPRESRARNAVGSVRDVGQSDINVQTASCLMTMDGECDGGVGFQQRASRSFDVHRFISGCEPALPGRQNAVDIDFHVLIVMDIKLKPPGTVCPAG